MNHAIDTMGLVSSGPLGCHVVALPVLPLSHFMPEQAGQQAPQAAGIGVWLNRVFLGFCIYVLVFGNPLKSLLPDVTNPTTPDLGIKVDNVSAPTVATPTSPSGKHHPLIHSGVKLVRFSLLLPFRVPRICFLASFLLLMPAIS